MESIQKRILVTGGAGFLGSHLCETLLSNGHEVVCVDNYYTGSKANIKHLIDNANFVLQDIHVFSTRTFLRNGGITVSQPQPSHVAIIVVPSKTSFI